MRKVELVCDYCGKVEPGGEEHFNLPKGWCVLGFHCQRFLAVDDWRITHHFCSQKCIDAAVKIDAKKEVKHGN